VGTEAWTRRRRWYQLSLRGLLLLTTLLAVALAIYVAWPPLGLDGYCPVTLVEKETWQRGDPFCFAIHDGCLYRFAGKPERKRFLETPDAFAPVASGRDITIATDQDDVVPGKREHGCYYRGKVYLFASEEALAKFAANPDRYAGETAYPQPDSNRLYALEGYCPVTLLDKWEWKIGDVRYWANHDGQAYLFVGPKERERFLADPDKFCPAFSGNDVVLAADESVIRPGRREHGTTYHGKIYLFANEASLDVFFAKSDHYVRFVASQEEIPSKPQAREEQSDAEH